MQKIYNIISGKKPLYTFITFSLSYTILLGILYIFSSMPLASKTEFMSKNALLKNNDFKGLDKSLLKQSALLKTAKNSLNNKMLLTSWVEEETINNKSNRNLRNLYSLNNRNKMHSILWEVEIISNLNNQNKKMIY